MKAILSIRPMFAPVFLPFFLVCFFCFPTNVHGAQVPSRNMDGARVPSPLVWGVGKGSPAKEVDEEGQKRFMPPWERTVQRDPRELKRQVFPRCIFPAVPETKRDAEMMARSCFEREKILEPLKNEELGTLISSFVKGKRLQDAWYLVFVQRVPDGRGSWIGVADTQVNATIKKVKGAVRVVSTRVTVSPDARRVPLASEKREEDVLLIARDALVAQGLAAQDVALRVDRRTIRYALGKWRLMAEVKPPSVYRVHVDANSGEFWVGEDIWHLDGTVSGRLELVHEGGPPTDLETIPLSSLRVRARIGAVIEEVYTDAAGNFSLPVSAAATIGGSLQGRWVSVRDDLSDPLMLAADIAPGDTAPRTFLFNPEGTGEEETAQTNAYYHTTFIHDWLRERGISEEIDRPVTARANRAAGYTCAATYNVGWEGEYVISFGRSGPHWSSPDVWCNNMAFDRIIYHEYGHFVDHILGGIYASYGISEGWGDLIAVYALNNPVGVSYRSDRATARRADTGYCFDAYRGGIHERGTAWSGFGWDLRQNLIGSGLSEADAIALSEELVIPVLNANPWHPREGVIEVLLRDDDDANLGNGTPHADQILAAAERHCIRPEADVVPPAAITDFSVRAEAVTGDTYTNYELTFTWTAPGDDGMTGTVAGYRLFRGERPIGDDIIDAPDFEISDFLGSLLPGGSLQTRSWRWCFEVGTTHYFAIAARDENDLFSGLSNVVSFSTPADTTPPVLSGIDVIAGGETIATISWQQSDPEYSGAWEQGAVDYGVTPDYGNTVRVRADWQSTMGCSGNASFITVLLDLTPGVLYHFRVRSHDGAGNEAVSDDYTFPPHECGNGAVEPGEQCDDRNSADGDSCSSTCLREAPRLTIQDKSVGEGRWGGNVAAVAVEISWAYPSAVAVDYATADGSATAGADYTATSGTLRWAAGETGTKFVKVSILDDIERETMREMFTVVLSNPINASVERGKGHVVIFDDDRVLGKIISAILPVL